MPTGTSDHGQYIGDKYDYATGYPALCRVGTKVHKALQRVFGFGRTGANSPLGRGVTLTLALDNLFAWFAFQLRETLRGANPHRRNPKRKTEGGIYFLETEGGVHPESQKGPTRVL